MKNAHVIFLTGVLFVTGSLSVVSMDATADQAVKTEGRRIVVDFDQDGEYEPFFVKGVGYSPDPVRTFPSQYGNCRYTGEKEGEPQFTCQRNVYDNSAILDRDLPLIRAMNANVIRTWGDVTARLLMKANENDLKVIAGFWVQHNFDYVNGDVAKVKEDFVNYVSKFKKYPALFAWGLSNENALGFCSFTSEACDRDEQARAFHKLINEMAQAAHDIEGADFHPVIVVHADLGAVGRSNAGADDDALSAVDIHGINAYRGMTFGKGVNSLFQQYMARSKKPMLITEFGTDVWYTMDPENPSRGAERPDLQAAFVSSAWDDIVKNDVSAGGPNNGGVVFHYTDVWWQDKGAWKRSCSTHDYGYQVLEGGQVWAGGQPDGFSNPEWYGLVAFQTDNDLREVDTVQPRMVYYALQNKFLKQ
ncbi:MAG: hypothetical protein K8S27_16640 [Candidatus Omnitrophica bacterium]|nr:hypothetical protein [Candidatus Omnitrophota bacterium]